MATSVGDLASRWEALTGVAVAALTLYDMMKSADKTMRIEGIALVHKVKK